MKKVLSITIMLLVAIASSAQEINKDSIMEAVLKTGTYEVKKVVNVDGANATTLYVRAMNALSDWTGSDGNSRAGLDFCDKDAGIVTYKGEVYNGSRKLLVSNAKYYTDFTMKVRCKDGRAQITINVPSVMVITRNGKQTIKIRDVVKQQMKGRDNRKGFDGLSVHDVVDLLMENMEAALSCLQEEDF